MFDKEIDRRKTHSLKWDMMEPLYGVSPDDGLSMWVADMDFACAPVIQEAVGKLADTGIYGYYGDEREYKQSICWWMQTRHNWHVDPAAIFSTSGLVNGAAVCIDAFSKPGDGVILFTPVYHAFARVLHAAGRRVAEMKLVAENGEYRFDFEAYEAAMRGNEKMLVLCSPHNPGGRVWSRAELEQVAAFAIRHDLVIVSDEIHHDLVFDGATHIPMAHIEGIEDRLLMLTSSSKTFNIAGGYLGNVIIHDTTLRDTFARRVEALGVSVGTLGRVMTTAAYSSEGAAWLDQLLPYVAENCRLFDQAVNSIPGLRSMPLEATYLAWVDFSGTGMEIEEISKRVAQDAKIAASQGFTFGAGGETFLRFNLATPRVRVEAAVERLKEAFADLQ